MKKVMLAIGVSLLTGGAYAEELFKLQAVKAENVKAAVVEAGSSAPALEVSPEKISGQYSYQCVSTNKNGPYGIKSIQLEVNGDNNPFLLSFKVKRPVTEKYLVDTEYKPKPGGAMQGFLRLNVKDPDHTAYAEGVISPFYAEKSLVTGGYEVNGGMGGYIKVAGAGYSWAKYLCTRVVSRGLAAADCPDGCGGDDGIVDPDGTGGHGGDPDGPDSGGSDNPDGGSGSGGSGGPDDTGSGDF
ncbi:MAG: hypothetical protein WCW52_05230 [Elusimicrobiales bacterium]|jgi:hypothetical protein